MRRVRSAPPRPALLLALLLLALTGAVGAPAARAASAARPTAPAGTAVLDGRITGAGGSPVAGAVVTARTAKGAAAGAVPSDATGIYRIVLPVGDYSLVVAAPATSGLPPVAIPNVSLPADRSLDIALAAVADAQAHKRVVFSGRVTDHGVPAAGAQVLLDQNYQIADVETTGPDGRFQLSVPRGRATLSITSTSTSIQGRGGVTIGSREFDVLRDRDVAVELGSIDTTISVEDIHRVAVPGARVSVSELHAKTGDRPFFDDVPIGYANAWSIGQTGPGGTYHARLLPGNVDLKARGPDDTAAVGPAQLAFSLPSAGPVVITLPATVPLTGQVRDADGRPLAATTVSAAAPFSSSSYQPPASVMTDAGGRFLIGVLPGMVRLIVSDSKPLPTPNGSFSVDTSLDISGPRELDIVVPLQPASVLVLDAAGRPAAGAEVRFRGAGARAALGAGVSGSVSGGLVGRTDAAGMLRGLTVLATGQAQVLPAPESVSAPTDQPIDLSRGSATVRLARGGALSGRFVDGRGVPIEGLTVDLEPEVLDGGTLRRQAVSDADGRWAVSSAPGRRRLEAHLEATGGGSRTELAVRTAGFDLSATARDVGDVVLLSTAVQVRAQDEAGAPLELPLYLRSARGKKDQPDLAPGLPLEEFTYYVSGQTPMTVTAAAGDAELALDTPGGPGASAPVDARHDRTVIVVLPGSTGDLPAAVVPEARWAAGLPLAALAVVGAVLTTRSRRGQRRRSTAAA